MLKDVTAIKLQGANFYIFKEVIYKIKRISIPYFFPVYQ